MSLYDKVMKEKQKAENDQVEIDLINSVKKAMPSGAACFDPVTNLKDSQKQLIKEATTLINNWNQDSLEYDSSKVVITQDFIRYVLNNTNKIMWENRVFLVSNNIKAHGDTLGIKLDTYYDNGFFRKNIKKESLAQISLVVESVNKPVKQHLFGTQEYVFLRLNYDDYVLFRDGYIFQVNSNFSKLLSDMPLNQLSDALAKNIQHINYGTRYSGEGLL